MKKLSNLQHHLHCSSQKSLVVVIMATASETIPPEGPSIEVVCQAIQALYHSNEPIATSEASKWLGELQSSVSRTFRIPIFALS